MEEREFLYLVLHFINTTTLVASIFGSGEARRGSIPRSAAVTEEQRSQNRKARQPSGRRFFLAPTSLLTPFLTDPFRGNGTYLMPKTFWERRLRRPGWGAVWKIMLRES